METQFWLHYIGIGLYRHKHFEIESLRLGVQRAISFHLIKKFRFGEPVLLAHYHGRKSQSAEVFGYFVINGLTHNLPKEIYNDLLETLDIEKIDNTSRTESRACGSYTVASTVYVNETLESLAEKIEKACKKHDINPNKFKFFIKGRYIPFKNSFVLSPAKFTRSYMRIKLDGFDLKMQQVEDENLVWVLDYEKRAYLSKKQRDALLSYKLDEYLEENKK